jgi:uncharacterized RDD family membrane protein YckC
MDARSATRRKDDGTMVEVWRPASLVRRAGAWIVDMTLLMAVVLVVASVTGLQQTRELSVQTDVNTTVTGTVDYIPAQSSGLMLAVFSALYSIPMWRLARGTLGQMLVGLRVTSIAEPDPLPWSRAALRWLLLFGWTSTVIASTVDLLVWPATFLFIAWFAALIGTTAHSEDGRGWHDRLAGSVVRSRQREISYASSDPDRSRRAQPPRRTPPSRRRR